MLIQIRYLHSEDRNRFHFDLDPTFHVDAGPDPDPMTKFYSCSKIKKILTFVHSSVGLHCRIFLVNVIGFIISIFWTPPDPQHCCSHCCASASCHSNLSVKSVKFFAYLMDTLYFFILKKINIVLHLVGHGFFLTFTLQLKPSLSVCA
jgi:hypothetical protein